MDKKAILFVMTDDIKNCDEVAEYLEGNFPELKDSVLVIHTKKNGEISEAAAGKAKTFDFVFVDEESFKKYKPSSFKQLVSIFREYKNDGF